MCYIYCINGTLYSLLKKQKFKNEARKIRLDSKLKNYQTDNQQLKKQINYIIEELNNPPEQEEEFDENFEENVNAKDDEEENSYDEYTDADSIDCGLLEEHYKVLGDFIIKNNELNKIEEDKIIKFMRSNPYMSNNVAKNNAFTNSLTSTLKGEDANRPLHRPTTPMSNLSLTGTSQIYKDKNNSKEGQNDYEKQLKIPEDSAQAFMKKDKIKRTPQRNYYK